MLLTAIESTGVRFPSESKVALIKFRDLSIYVGLCRSRIYALIAAGDFPRPIKVGKSSRWLQNEIDFWLQERVQHRDRASH